MQLYIESLGCARNQVDSENMAGRLRRAGWSLTRDPAQAEVIVVNTCGFVESAINESIDTILTLANYKKEGCCNRLVVTGCLPERFREAIVEALPEVDQFLGTAAFPRIVEAAGGHLNTGNCLLPDLAQITIEPAAVRERSHIHTAYLKIAEGCSRRCTYCIIPRLRGRQKSRPLEHILDDARRLIADGVRELNLVAQETTGYGRDLSTPIGLETVLTRLAELDDTVWIRFLYGHPESISDRVIEAVAAKPNLCPYFDVPIQHISAPILKRMGRRYDQRQLLDLFERIRRAVPGCVIRTTLMVGFPGETEADFQELLQFVQTVRFDHLGVFVYSDAQDLPSHRLPGHISDKVARSRHDTLMKRQLTISAANLAALVGRTLPVLIESAHEPGLYQGRSILQAPEVDGLTFVRTGSPTQALPVGQVTLATIRDAMEYDLIGEAL